MNNPDPIYTPGRITFGHQAESNWHKAEALRLDEENLKLRWKLAEAVRLLERCVPDGNKTGAERAIFLQRMEKEF
jgi:hypothetical protein